MSAKLNIFLLLIHTTIIFAVLPQIQKCPLNDDNCIKKSAQSVISSFAAGIPEVDSESLEPVHIDHIYIDLAGLQLTLRDSKISGLSKSVIDNIHFDGSNKVLQFAYHVAPIILRGKYKAEGRLLILPIEGDGDVTIKIRNLKLFMTMPYEIIKNENGKDVINLKSYKYTHENKENTHFKLTNLFKGNKALSDAMHKFMNEQWSLISDQFATPIMDRPLQKIFTAIQTYLRSQPLENIVS